MLLCFFLFLSGVVACLATGHTLLWALLLGFALFFALGRVRGFSARALFAMAWKKGRSSLIVVPVFFLIGMVTALWRSSGTISFFLYYGLRGIAPPLFVLVAFLLSGLLSYALGTSFGVVGTAGVVLITLARSGGVDLAVTAGAILSGAYFGDRCSPMSSCAMLVAACTGTELYGNVREMLKTGALPTALTAGVFLFLSLRNPIVSTDAAVLGALRESFSLSPIVLLPALAMLALPLFKVPVKWAMALSASAAFLLTVFWQGLPLDAAVWTAIFGYIPAQDALGPILSGGGVVSMLLCAGVVTLTSLYAGILEGIDALSPAKAWAERLAQRLGLFPAAVLISLLLVAVFCNQSVAVLMAEQLLCESYRCRDASRQELAIDLENSGVTLAGLIPWSIALTVPLQTLGVGLEALPYCVLLYAIPLCYLFTKRYFRAGQNSLVST